MTDPTPSVPPAAGVSQSGGENIAGDQVVTQTAGGDILQMTQALPGSAVNILMAVMLFVVLGRRGARG